MWLVTPNMISYHAWNLEILYWNHLNFDFMVQTKSKDLYVILTLIFYQTNRSFIGKFFIIVPYSSCLLLYHRFKFGYISL